MNTRSMGKRPATALAPGQVWKMEHGHIRIVALGKRLVHYKMLKDLRQVRSTQMSRVDNMEAYLKSNAAQLVENGGSD